MAKTAEIHKLEGTYRGDRHSDDIKAPMMARLPKPPEGMSKEAAEYWRIKCIDLKQMGLLYRSDMDILKKYCNIMVTIDKCQVQIDNALNHDLMMKHVKSYNEAMKFFYQFNCALGQNPLARTKIKLEKQEEESALDAI